MAAMISDPVALCQRPLRESLLELLETLSEDARELGCGHWLKALLPIVNADAGDASWLRARHNLHHNLNDVVRETTERLMAPTSNKSWEHS